RNNSDFPFLLLCFAPSPPVPSPNGRGEDSWETLRIISFLSVTRRCARVTFFDTSNFRDSDPQSGIARHADTRRREPESELDPILICSLTENRRNEKSRVPPKILRFT